MNKISKAGHGLYKSPHEWPLGDSNNGRAVGRPCLDWTQEAYGFAWTLSFLKVLLVTRDTLNTHPVAANLC